MRARSRQLRERPHGAQPRPRPGVCMRECVCVRVSVWRPDGVQLALGHVCTSVPACCVLLEICFALHPFDRFSPLSHTRRPRYLIVCALPYRLPSSTTRRRPSDTSYPTVFPSRAGLATLRIGACVGDSCVAWEEKRWGVGGGGVRCNLHKVILMEEEFPRVVMFCLARVSRTAVGGGG